MKLYTASGFLLILLITGCSRQQQDFDQVCGYFAELKSQLEQRSLSAAERGDFILDQVLQKLPADSNARIAWEAIATAEASERYYLFVEAATSSGLTSWQCPSMQQLAPTLE
jgi:hypothetical protein